jgi:hypothetical protein
VIPCQEQTPAAGPHAQVIINIVAAAAVCTLAIDPTFYPVAWENMPFSTTLIATGGVGPFSWSATGLPAGLTVDPLTGIISGTPAPGTCGPYTVTVTVTDLGTCPTTPGCCPDVIRPFTLIVDCYANYPIITYFTYTACDFNVAIGPGLTAGQTQVLIDGTQEAILGANQSETFTSYPCESHLVMVNQTIAGPDPNTSFEVIGSNIKMVNDIDNYAYFDYAQKVRIETGSEPTGISQPRGTGWYAIGDYFSTTTASPVNSDNQKGIKYIFRAWGLPDGSTNPNRDLVFTVNKAGAATALYDTYYLLQLKSDYPPVAESSWELKDSTAEYDLALQPVPRLGFWGGLGAKLRPINGKGSIPMNEPQVVEIRWKKDCTIPAIIMSVLALVVIGLVYNFGFRRRHPVAELATTPAKTKAPARAKPVAKSGFCPKCGNRVRKDEDFCKKCGKKLK